MVIFLPARFRDVTCERAAMSDDDDLVLLYTTNRQGEVVVIKAWLDDEGIPYATDNEVMSVIYPVDGMAMVKFWVRRRDARKAAQMLLSHGLK